MKKLKIQAVTILCAVLCAALTIFSSLAKDGVSQGLKYCADIIIPSMFPFLIISNFISSSQCAAVLGKWTATVTRGLFRLPSNTGAIILLSLTCGYPTGAVMISSMLHQGIIDKETARRLLKFCFSCGLPFGVTAVGAVLLGSKKAGFIVYISVTLAAIIMGAAGAIKKEKIKNDRADLSFFMSVPDALVNSVNKSINTIWGVCAYVLIFTCVENMLPMGEQLKTYVLPLFEITSGSILSAGKVPLWLTAVFLGFGGLCIHGQLSFAVIESEMKISSFLCYRGIQSLLSGAIAYVLVYFFPVAVNASFTASYTGEFVSVSVPVTAMLMIMSVVLVIDIGNRKKLC